MVTGVKKLMQMKNQDEGEPSPAVVQEERQSLVPVKVKRTVSAPELRIQAKSKSTDAEVAVRVPEV